MRNQSCISLPLRFIQRFRLQNRPKIIQTFLSQNVYNLNMINVLYKILSTTTSFIWKMCSEEQCCTNGHKTRARNWHRRLSHYWCSNTGLSSSVLQRTRSGKKREKIKINCISVSFAAFIVTISPIKCFCRGGITNKMKVSKKDRTQFSGVVDNSDIS